MNDFDSKFQKLFERAFAQKLLKIYTKNGSKK